VKDGLLDVSHIELLENGIDNLGSFEGDFEKELSDVGDAAERKRKEYENAKEKVNNLKGDLDQTKTNISDTKDHIRKLTTDSRIVQIRRSEKTTAEGIPNRKAGDIRGDIQEVRKEASRELVKAGTPLYAVQSLEYTLSELKELSEQGKLPRKFRTLSSRNSSKRGVYLWRRPD